MSLAQPIFSRAEAADRAAVVAILDEAAAWLAGAGIRQWPRSFEPTWLDPAILEGTVWVARVGGRAAATFQLTWADPLWDDDGTAGYLHRFAVRRPYAGLGASVLEHVARLVAAEGRTAIRLDCVSWNHSLRAYYARAGFVHRGDLEMRDSPWPGSGSTPTYVLSRYERVLPG